jgi:ribosomal protein S18 acetylase RimI-like enzyme
VEIRRASEDDVPRLTELAVATYAESFGHSMSPEDLAAHVDLHLSAAAFRSNLSCDTVCVAADGDALLGYVQLGQGDMGLELKRLYVDSGRRNEGIGGALMQAAMESAKEVDVFLDVWDQNLGARRFYARFGFVEVGQKEFVLPSGAATTPDIIMCRQG